MTREYQQILTILHTGLQEKFCQNHNLLLRVVFSSQCDVTCIPDSAFDECTALREIALPQTVTIIGQCAFRKCWSLTDASLRDGLKTIGCNAFADCELTHLNAPSTLEVIEDGAFEKCLSLNGVEFAERSSIKVIGCGAFAGCAALQDIDLPSTVTDIGKHAFAGSGLTVLRVSGRMESIEDGTFKDCAALREVAFEEGSLLKVIGSDAFYDCRVLQAIALPPSVTEIGKCAFRGSGLIRIRVASTLEAIGDEACMEHFSLRAVEFPESYSLKVIGSDAFADCKSLQEIALPATVTDFGDGAFRRSGLIRMRVPWKLESIRDCTFLDCTSLREVAFEARSCLKLIGDRAFDSCKSLQEIALPPTVKYIGKNAFEESGLIRMRIPRELASISDCTFRDCVSLREVTFEEVSSLKVIEDYAFESCKALEDIALPPTVKYIGESAFEESGLIRLRLPRALASISSYTFCDCVSLREVTFPEGSSLKVIEEYAFHNCKALQDIAMPPAVAEIGKSAFSASGLIRMCIPRVLASVSKYTFCDCVSLREVTFPECSSLKVIGSCAFYGCKALQDIALPPALADIVWGAFERSGLIRVRVPRRLEHIESSTFNKCVSLREVTFEKGSPLKSIGGFTFQYCRCLQEIVLPLTVANISSSAFADSGLIRLVVLLRVERIEQYAFSGCRSLKEVKFMEGSSLKVIEFRAFDTCKALEEITLPPTVTSLEYEAFARSGLVRVALSWRIESIEDETFVDCVSLREVTFTNGSSLKSIGYRAFANCIALQEIALPPTVTVIGTEAFSTCGLLSIAISPNVSHVWHRAFEGCRNLVSVGIAKSLTVPIEFGHCCFQNCPSLNIIQLPSKRNLSSRLFQNCTSLETAYGADNVVNGVLTRFDGYPAHKACYYATENGGTEDLRQVVAAQDPNYMDRLFDPFGQTPFHILFSAAKKRTDLLHVLLDVYPANLLGCVDKEGNYAMDYLIASWTEAARSLAQVAIQKWMIDGMASWGIPQWRSSISTLMDSLLNDEDQEMDGRKAVWREACQKMGRFELMEATSLVELWMWKMNMSSLRTGTKRMAIDRCGIRTRCGSPFVLPEIVAYLWDKEQGCWY